MNINKNYNKFSHPNIKKKNEINIYRKIINGTYFKFLMLSKHNNWQNIQKLMFFGI